MINLDEPLWRTTSQETIRAEPLSTDLTVDIAVIGGGYTGCSAALTAARAGASVCLLEAEQIGFGGSGRNVGLVNAGLWLPPDQIRSHLGRAAGDLLIDVLANGPGMVFDLIKEQDISCDPVKNGTLHCAHSASGFRDLQARHAQLTASGAPVSLLSASEASKRTGSTEFHGALFDPRAGTIQPLAYAIGLARAAKRLRAAMFENSPVKSLKYENGSWTLRTPNGSVRARSVIQATNAYHSELGHTAPAYVPVYYFQFATDPLAEDLRNSILPLREGCWDTGLIMTSFRMDSEGRFIIGAMGDLEHIGRSAHQNWVRRKMVALYPQLAQQPLVAGWHGRIAMTSDHLPKITKIGPSALSAHGFSGRGIAPGTVFGRLMAECLLEGDLSKLPVPPVEEYRENWTGLRRAYFEAGAAVTHLTKARF